MPDGVVDLPPDWVCEIVSPGHEHKDNLLLPLLLQRHAVPFYCLMRPEDRTLIAHQLDSGHFRVIGTLTDQSRARIPPFEAIEIDLACMFGEG